MNHFPVLLPRNLHAPCASQARACVLCAKLLQCCCPRTWPARGPRCNATSSKHFPHTSQCTLRTSHSTLHTCTSHSTLHLISNHVSFSHLISALLISSHLIPSLLTCHQSKFFSTVFIPSEALSHLSHLLEVVLQSSCTGSTSQKVKSLTHIKACTTPSTCPFPAHLISHVDAWSQSLQQTHSPSRITL